MDFIIALAPLILGWILDMIFGDPERLPHPVVGFGKAISFLSDVSTKVRLLCGE